MNYPTKGAAQWQDPDHWERDRERKGRERETERDETERQRETERFLERKIYLELRVIESSIFL